MITFLQSYLLSCNVRLQMRNGRAWRVEMAFAGNPVESTRRRFPPPRQHSRTTHNFTFDISENAGQTCDAIIQVGIDHR